MRKLSCIAGTLALSLVAAAAAQPTLGKERMQDRVQERSSRTGFEARAEAIAPELAVRAGARVDAIRECNSDAAKFPEYAWGNRDFDTYRACMAQKGQTE